MNKIIPTKNLSKIIILLLVIRPIINQFRSVKIASMAGYNLSYLTIWSLVFIFLVILRIILPPRNKKYLLIPIIIYIVYMGIVGIPRALNNSVIITSYLYTILFLLSIAVANKLISDFNLLKISQMIFISSIILFIMHITAVFWSDKPVFNAKLGNYIGGFEDKHNAAETFLVILPFNLYYYLKTRKKISLFIFLLNIFFLAFTFQRKGLLAVMIFGFVFFLLSKRIKYAFYGLGIIAIIYIALPNENKNTFIEKKFTFEIEEYQSGDIDALGATRWGILVRSIDLFFNKLDVPERLVGLGTAQSNRLHPAGGYANIQLIQIIIDYGLIGLLIFSIVVFRIFKMKYYDYKNNKNIQSIIALSMFSVWAVQFFVSMNALQGGGIYTLFAMWLYNITKSTNISSKQNNGVFLPIEK